ncbi:MAG: hypothetical protein FJ387_10855 [Verrucomicrobia bacterium]|nr:hypothetical protein [Verrucomicrobiota bacterium]
MTPVPRPCLVDTNVAVVANGNSDQADDSLVEKCIDALLELTGKGGLVLDDGGFIFDEYRQNLNLSGQPGAGDAFLKWVHDHQWNPARCERRPITCLNEQEQEFAEFPSSKALKAFDRSDRKFVAAANAGRQKRPILEAVDFKWWGWKDALAAEGIAVVFLDPQAAEAGYRKHFHHE